jgi:hypothetical protein
MNEIMKFEKPALVVGIASMAASLLGALVIPEHFFRAYLMGYLYWLAIALGCLPLLMLHHLAGGRWGFAIRRILESGSRTLPVLVLLFIPILFGIHHLYEWSHAESVAEDATLQAKSAYLNVPFFVVRAVIYFAAWLLFAYYLNKLSARQDRTGDPSLLRTFQLLSAPGIVVYALTITFASVDWAMSLEPHWFSTIYGMLFMVSQALAALSFAIPLAAVLSISRPMSEVMTGDVFHDLGNLLLAFVMLWAYLSFSQYLIIWSGNLPEEIPWYLRRGTGGWQWIAATLAVFHLAVPLVLLLGRGNKRRKQIISGIAVGILLMRFVDTVWLIKPAFAGSVASIHWLDIAAAAGIGGIWIWALIGQLQKMPLLPLNDPNFGGGPTVEIR